MVVVFDILRKIDAKLQKIKDEKKIENYRLILKLNMSATLYVITDTMSDSDIKKIIDSKNIDIDINIISHQEFELDDYYSSLFEKTDSFDMGLRRSLNNLIVDDNDTPIESSCPILSFYSHKGGVGRTTALALFASYYAVHYSKSVFIIDCDFEAPGIINFYDISASETVKNGIVEYIKDKEAFSDINIRDDYTYQVSKKYTGDGDIYLMPAGSIFDDSERDDYLEALARLDIHSTSTIVEQFKGVIADINKEFRPDVILIDSRTGFNDIFGIIVNKLSNIVLGFFGNNIQNRPGLNFFLNTLLRKKREINIILILSIISSSFEKELGLFKDQVYDYIQNNIEQDLESMPALPLFCLARYPSLEKIGTDTEDLDDFTALIKRKMLSDYNDLFEKMVSFIEPGTKETELFDKAEELEKAETIESPPKEQDKIADLKNKILKELSDNFPEPYAENEKYTEEFFNTKFYIRNCMEEIFNQDKFLLIGGKGTGKTAFYKALRDKDFFDKLKTKAQKNHLKYSIIHIISLKEDKESRDKYIEVAETFSQSEIDEQDKDFFYTRFWKIYIWSAIKIDADKIGFSSDMEVRPILNDSATAQYFKEHIYNDDKFKKIEQELYAIDDYLKKKDKNLIIIFDQLDKVIKPILWSIAVSPLIKICQPQNYKRIYPKLLLRRDLFNKLGNLTNKESLEKQAINLEWEQEELYAFFFKAIFATSSEAIFDYAKETGSISDTILQTIRQKQRRKNSYNQLPPDKSLLKPLIETFFGKYAGRFGETYDWIYRNLENADNTISLRPFLDLIKYAVENQNENSSLNRTRSPILSNKSFNAEVRKKAVHRHFEDLSKEEGNELLTIIINDIKNDKVPRNMKISPLMKNDFNNLMRRIIDRNKLSVSITELEEILRLNGIIFTRYLKGGKKKYTFAYLYKYYLGLKIPQIRRNSI